MSSWIPAHSLLLSRMLNEVTGTCDMVHIRQDCCKTMDSKDFTRAGKNMYFTGSKAEGLSLPGSDDDAMYEINAIYDLKIKQASSNELFINRKHVFLMDTDNVRPGFAMLRSLSNIQSNDLMDAMQLINGTMYLSSFLLLQNRKQTFLDMVYRETGYKDVVADTQGPSVELNVECLDESDSGIDNVSCIHCPFWPDTAAEWITRPRRSRWPSSTKISTIKEFGFHLVPKGNLLSDLNMMEWSISFAVAERALVWSFSHVQMQFYAVMKLIFKEYIKRNCKSENYILSSYLIKTFLFWTFEDKNESFWQGENFMECLQYLLSGFFKCLCEGVLRHYFIPRYNLFEIKLTPRNQSELLRLMGAVIQQGMSVMKYCPTLRKTWFQFNIYVESGYFQWDYTQRRYFLDTDSTMIDTIHSILELYNSFESPLIAESLFQVCNDSCKTSLIQIVKNLALCYLSFSVLPSVLHSPSHNSTNKAMYQMLRRLDAFSCDISTSKLMKGFMFFNERRLYYIIACSWQSVVLNTTVCLPQKIYTSCFSWIFIYTNLHEFWPWYV